LLFNLSLLWLFFLGKSRCLNNLRSWFNYFISSWNFCLCFSSLNLFFYGLLSIRILFSYWLNFLFFFLLSRGYIAILFDLFLLIFLLILYIGLKIKLNSYFLIINGWIDLLSLYTYRFIIFIFLFILFRCLLLFVFRCVKEFI
jgi:hypothetical protein